MPVVVHLRAHLQIFQHGHTRKNTPSFGGLGDTHPRDFMGRFAGDLLAIKNDLTFTRLRLAADGHHQG